MPPFTPGSHITVTAPSGQKRRYSLCNDPSERDRYLIAVKQETTGRGGSLSFTKGVNEGDAIAVEPPANEFEMAKTEPKRLIFIAGGIGITPIRAMILHCLRQGKTSFMLYYFTRTPSAMAFRDEFAKPSSKARSCCITTMAIPIRPMTCGRCWSNSAAPIFTVVGRAA